MIIYGCKGNVHKSKNSQKSFKKTPITSKNIKNASIQKRQKSNTNSIPYILLLKRYFVDIKDSQLKLTAN